jgi:hypothetical protein
MYCNTCICPIGHMHGEHTAMVTNYTVCRRSCAIMQQYWCAHTLAHACILLIGRSQAAFKCTTITYVICIPVCSAGRMFRAAGPPAGLAKAAKTDALHAYLRMLQVYHWGLTMRSGSALFLLAALLLVRAQASCTLHQTDKSYTITYFSGRQPLATLETGGAGTSPPPI